MSWDPASGITFGQYMRAKGVQVRPAGWSWQTRDQVLEDSPTRKTVRDQAGNDVTERTDEHGGYHRDVSINLRS
ncbi:hypothetical protein FH608_046040 [Nonomuraea phyllanthi]|uniref:Uncharacterized protein n=1 Tax=Nonomuraea phyllanthi TaxID=2219224 RepID=A0A5C4V689_9ACTN|nr:hypothetical protein [Nonomuraea phyllanthi]KAB8186857.1 hypothetical protein FH608_046040 [Nonomuraea phyllanthi]